jgi:hypothetical protein
VQVFISSFIYLFIFLLVTQMLPRPYDRAAILEEWHRQCRQIPLDTATARFPDEPWPKRVDICIERFISNWLVEVVWEQAIARQNNSLKYVSEEEPIPKNSVNNNQKTRAEARIQVPNYSQRGRMSSSINDSQGIGKVCSGN